MVTSKRKRVALFRSNNRFESFRATLLELGAEVVILDFADESWIEADYYSFDVVIHFPTFRFSSNHPLALRWVYDNLMHLHRCFPHLSIFPDPAVIPYYSDKYRQYLFLRHVGLEIPETHPLETTDDVVRAAETLGFPFVVKNRYGAGGDYVRFVHSIDEVMRIFEFARLRFAPSGGFRFLLQRLSRKYFLRAFKGRKHAEYPFWSPPLLAQQFVEHDHDLKVVIGDGEAVEAHWRRQATPEMQKMNIDGGGIGEWSYVPEAAVEACLELTRRLDARWLNVDLLPYADRFLISEFSPVWHHYRYQEKPSFVYKDDYNLKTPIAAYCDLERIICESYLGR